ncbi:MAG TPA: protein kinase [Candidatus Nanoarchaeia archaeon]|nr:protein kinase [Candidatus Nanoarchaeia archaeon]
MVRLSKDEQNLWDEAISHKLVSKDDLMAVMRIKREKDLPFDDALYAFIQTERTILPVGPTDETIASVPGGNVSESVVLGVEPSEVGKPASEIPPTIRSKATTKTGLDEILIESKTPAPKPVPAKGPKDPLIGTQVDDYKILAVLGKGGMGAVYLAMQDNPARKVALKIPLSKHQQFVERLKREAVAMSQLSDPGIPQVYKAGVLSDGRPYFAMEFVEGETLDHVLDNGDLSLEGRLDLLLTVCNTLNELHSKGYVHRDLKPANIMVKLEGKNVKRVWVMDLGLAKTAKEKDARIKAEINKAKDPNLTGDNALGTPQYAAPEQLGIDVSDKPIDKRADIYSLGIMLYEFATELQLRGGFGNAMNLLSHVIQEGDYKSAREANPEIRRDFDSILKKALQKNPKDRYQTVGQLKADVQEYMRKGLVSAHKYSKFTRLWRNATKHPRTLAASIALALAGITAGPATYGLVAHANAKAAEANAKTAEANAKRKQSELERLQEKEKRTDARELKLKADQAATIEQRIAALENAVKAAPTWNEPYFWLAEVFYEARQRDKAFPLFEKANELSLKDTGKIDVISLFYAGMTAIDQEDKPELASRYFGEIIKNAPDKKDAYVLLAKSIKAFNSGEIDEAIKLAEEAANNSRISEAFYILSMYHSAPIVSNFFNEGLKLETRKELRERADPKKALEFISKAIEKNDRRWRFFYHRAQIHDQLFDDLESALKDADKSMNMGVSNLAMYVIKATVLQNNRHYEEALRVLDEAEAKLGPLHPENRGLKGVILFNLASKQKNPEQSRSLYETAEKEFEYAVENGQNKADDTSWLGCTRQQLGKLEEALANHNKAIELDPLEPKYVRLRGECYEKMGRTEEALADYAAAVQKGDPRGLYAKGLLLPKLGIVDEAITTLEAYIATGHKFDRERTIAYLQQLKEFRERSKR